MERLEIMLSGREGKSAMHSDCIETLDKNWQTLKNGALLVSGNLANAPS